MNGVSVPELAPFVQKGTGCGPACRRGGCIGTTPLEALAIAEHLGRHHARPELSAIRKRLIHLSERYAGLSLPQRVETKLPCGLFDPMLPGCIAYAARPLACADAFRRDGTREDAARPGPHNGEPSRESESAERAYATNLAAAIRSNLSAGRLDMNLYELNSAVLRALNCRDAMARWLNREDIFQGCLCIEATGPPRLKEPPQPVAVHASHALPSPTRQRLARRLEEGEVDL